ncbi:DUF4145 domain-containing protein [Amylibacter sp. IMCC11727]|uniref:DUF4145 domain-containing protein n=1 Tax=Amylibacter sp. IMCC11727 TaxID=3039851 RepID=UPI00244DAB3B|nr:DUF4145 domain-containing protein [Amylibacter sp. IMCC11727]WGI23483.1 DUF4145 domain-containing protein [Amylibacter sp. IMCC11727]
MKRYVKALPYELGHCSKCASERARVRKEFKTTDTDQHVSVTNWHMIVECSGCGEIYFKTKSHFSENYEHDFDENGNPTLVQIEEYEFWPPAPPRPMPRWLVERELKDGLLHHLLHDIYEAWANNLAVLAAIGTRTAFDKASEIVGVDINLSFSKKLDQLFRDGHISGRDKISLHSLVDAGSAAAHRNWRPSDTEIEMMISVLESFVERAILIPERTKKLSKNIPKKNTLP